MAFQNAQETWPFLAVLRMGELVHAVAGWDCRWCQWTDQSHCASSFSIVIRYFDQLTRRDVDHKGSYFWYG